jgi:hypothetical protein
VILGVDRLDYTKGLVNRLKAFEVFLERHPEQHGTVSFLQISVPSRTDVLEYQQLKEEMDQLVGKFSRISCLIKVKSSPNKVESMGDFQRRFGLLFGTFSVASVRMN